jgi:hypothetical protein
MCVTLYWVSFSIGKLRKRETLIEAPLGSLPLEHKNCLGRLLMLKMTPLYMRYFMWKFVMWQEIVMSHSHLDRYRFYSCFNIYLICALIMFLTTFYIITVKKTWWCWSLIPTLQFFYFLYNAIKIFHYLQFYIFFWGKCSFTSIGNLLYCLNLKMILWCTWAWDLFKWSWFCIYVFKASWRG